MVENIKLARVYGSYRGGASYLINTAVPVTEYMSVLINNTNLVTYSGKYSGVAYIYVPSATATYRFHEAWASTTQTARVIGMEIQHVNPTHFRFNYVLGFVTPTIPNITDRYGDGSTHLYDAWYKIAWFINRTGTGDAFWTNNKYRAISNISNKPETFIIPRQHIFNGYTPIGFKLCELLTTTDPTVDGAEMATLFTNNVNVTPIYLDSGAVTQNGKTRSCYIDCGTPQIMNHATGQPFEHKTPTAPVDYSHVMDRCVIA